MNRIALSLVLALTPAALAAQVSARAQANSKTDVAAKTGATQATVSTSVDAELAVARERGLPTEPIRRRAAEARAKGRTEAQAVMAASRMRANLEASLDAMVQAGRTHPHDAE